MPLNHGKRRAAAANEDCTFLTVYSPADDGERLPVVVWYHGGASVTLVRLITPRLMGTHFGAKNA